MIVGADPLPLVTVSAACVHPVVAMSGKVAEAGPLPESVTASVTLTEPAELPL